MYAPSKEQYKATGTDGTQSPEPKTQNLNEKEGKLLPFSLNPRVGSSTVGNGAGDVQVFELPDAIKTVLVRWNSVKIDLNERKPHLNQVLT